MITKFLAQLKSLFEKVKPHLHKAGSHLSHRSQLAFASFAGLYWNLGPTNRYRVRLAAFAFAILSLGIVLGRVTNVNRTVKIETSDKALKVEASGVLELKLPGVKLNPEIYVFQSAEKGRRTFSGVVLSTHHCSSQLPKHRILEKLGELIGLPPW